MVFTTLVSYDEPSAADGGVLGLPERVFAALRERFPRGMSKWLDSKPLPVGGASKDRGARVCGPGGASGGPPGGTGCTPWWTG